MTGKAIEDGMSGAEALLRTLRRTRAAVDNPQPAEIPLKKPFELS